MLNVSYLTFLKSNTRYFMTGMNLNIVLEKISLKTDTSRFVN